MRKSFALTTVLVTLLSFIALLVVEGVAEEGKKGDAGAAKKEPEKKETARSEEKAAGAEAKSEDCYQFVAPLEAVMEVMDDVFQKMPEKLKAGKFKEVKRESLFIAEVANLATHFKEFRGKKEYIALAESMKSNALKMADAAAKKDENEVRTLHDKIEQTCDSCHAEFRDK